MLLAALITVALVAAVPDAGAHAELARSEPPSEGLLAVPPRTIEFWFTERVDPGAESLSLRLLDDQGQEIRVGGVRVDRDDPTHVVAEIEGLAPGTITVVWSARSVDDGHVLTGSFAFRVGAGRAPGAATVEGERPPVWAVATRWLTFLGAAIAAGGFAFGLVILRGDPDALTARRLRDSVAGMGAGAALTATAVEPLLQRAWPPAGVSRQVLGDVLAGLPAAWWCRPAALLPCLLIALVARRRGERTSARSSTLAWAGLALALISLLGLSLTSHAAARETWRLPAVVSNVVHQWSIALWVGGLVHLLLWWRVRTGSERQDALDAARRFSRTALPLALLGVATGVVNGGLMLPAARALWQSDYGAVLIAKVAILTVPLGLATFNRRALRRPLDLLPPAVRRAASIEAAVALAVVLVGSSLALLAPPAVEADRPAVADVPMPVLAAHNGQDLLAHLIFAPGRPGENTLRVRLTQWNGTPYAGEPPALVRLAISNIALGLEPVQLEANPDIDGSWTARGSQLSLPGWWNIDVTLRWPGQPDVIVPFYLLLPDPNLNGLDAPDDDPPSDPAAAEAYRRAMDRYTGMHRVRYTQSMANQLGTVAHGRHAVNDGADGSTPGFTFDIPGGWHYVVLGEIAWSKRPSEPWKQSKANPMVPPSRWDDEYAGARGFQFGREEMVNGELCRTVTFVVPGSQKQVVAWYIWWIGTETGRVHREMMISQTHYMLTDFYDFDAPVVIEPPAATGATATPVP